MLIIKSSQINFSVYVYYLYPWLHTYNGKEVVNIKTGHSCHLVSKYLLGVYVPDSVLAARDRAVNKTDKTNYPIGTYVPITQI